MPFFSNNENILSFKSDLSSEERGMYGSGKDETIIEEIDEQEANASLQEGDVNDVYGYDVTTISIDGTEQNPFLNTTGNGLKANILGMPLAFNKMADPWGRTFRNTIMRDLPMIFVVPGKEVLNNKLIDESGRKIGKGALLKAIENVTENLKIAVRGARSGNDLRFLGFKADYGNYYGYLQVFLSTLYASMGLSGTFKFDNFFSTKQANYGICFYGDNSTSISESATSDYTTTSVAQQANDLAMKNREAKLMLGINTSNASSFVSRALNLITTSVSELSEGVTTLSGILSRAGNIFGKVVNGSQLLYPEIWSNSTFDRSYNLSFKFYSPYGSKEAIFKFVYIPFAAWVCFSFPRQDNVMGYGQPFVMRISAPGYFESSMAVVSSISFKRGGSDNMWTIDNLPNEIEVEVSIKDLYSAIPITKKFGMMSYNIGLSSFIDCLAGIRSDQLSLLSSISRWVKTRLTVPNKLKNTLTGRISDMGYNLQNKINDFLR